MAGIRKGEPWGRVSTGPADADLAGDDADLAVLAAQRPGTRVSFHPGPTSDLARAVGLPGTPRRPGALEVAIDGLALDREPGFAVNAVVLGTPPDRMQWRNRSRRVDVTVDGRERFAGRAVAVVIASGQYLRGKDLVPRGHPGDGRAEVQVYELRPGERRGMRRRLPGGEHLPHPGIHELSGRRMEVRIDGGVAPLEADGVSYGRVAGLRVSVVPEALWLRI